MDRCTIARIPRNGKSTEQTESSPLRSRNRASRRNYNGQRVDLAATPVTERPVATAVSPGPHWMNFQYVRTRPEIDFLFRPGAPQRATPPWE